MQSYDSIRVLFQATWSSKISETSATLASGRISEHDEFPDDSISKMYEDVDSRAKVS